MKFHLNYIPKPSPFKIDLSNQILLAGSCFSDNIGNLLATHQFNANINPEGLFFNPESLCDSLNAIIANKPLDENLILKRDDRYVSYLHHSRVSGATKADLISQFRNKRERTHEFLKSADLLILTFGTAFVYCLADSKQVVANCHKQPAALFTKRILTTAEITALYSQLLIKLRPFNKDLKILFTISPVKYLKDGVEENVLSKAILRVAVNDIVQANENCYYFPAYELVNEDLRDYRFFKEDLAHPNDLAIQYVWDKFADSYFAEDTKKELREIHRKQLQLAHRPLNKQ